MKISFEELLKNTTVKYHASQEGVHLVIITPNLEIRSVQEEDIPYYQTHLWGDSNVMERFAEGRQRLYCGSDIEKEQKLRENRPYDYAQWRIKDMDNSWLKRLKNGNVWSGLTILNKEGVIVGHIVIGGGELAYFIVAQEWNKGYASEAAAALTRIALPILITRYGVVDPGSIVATVQASHEYSQRVLRSAGLKLGTEISVKTFNGREVERLEASVPTAVLIRDYHCAVECELEQQKRQELMQEEETAIDKLRRSFFSPVAEDTEASRSPADVRQNVKKQS